MSDYRENRQPPFFEARMNNMAMLPKAFIAILYFLKPVTVILLFIASAFFSELSFAQSSFTSSNTTLWLSPQDVEKINRDIEERRKIGAAVAEQQKQEADRALAERKKIQLENKIRQEQEKVRREQEEAYARELLEAQKQAQTIEIQAQTIEILNKAVLRAREKQLRAEFKFMNRLSQNEKDKLFKEKISATLSDPYSAAFSPDVVYSHEEGLCGYVDAKRECIPIFP